jgi:hypothetical protein
MRGAGGATASSLRSQCEAATQPVLTTDTTNHEPLIGGYGATLVASNSRTYVTTSFHIAWKP